MERLLITGVDSVVGANLALALRDRWEVVGLYFHQPVELPGCRTLPCGATPAELSAAVRGETPAWTIHAGPLAISSWDSGTPAGLQREPAAVAALAEAVAHTGGTLHCIATDAVFAGPLMFHDESSARSGVSHLAAIAAQVEDALRPRAESVLVARTNAYGWSVTPRTAGFVERAWASIAAHATVNADAERHATPILASDLAELLLVAWQRRLRGVCHLAGAERASPARVVAELAALQGERAALAMQAEQPRDGGKATAALETSLNTRRARRELGVPLPLLREGLARFADQAANGHRDLLRAAAGAECVAA
jgi:dTDP-4-dehydrorhamnose reductase